MQRVKNLTPFLIASLVGRHHSSLKDNFHTVNVTFEAHRLKRTLSRHAVIHVLKPGELILVDLYFPADARIKAVPGQTGSVLFVLFQSCADGFCFATAASLPFLETALPKIVVEFLEIFHLGNWSRPLPLQRLHAILNNRFFVPARRQAEQRFKDIMTCQGRITLDMPRVEYPEKPLHLNANTLHIILFINLATPPAEHRVGHRFRVIPPDFFGNTVKILECLHHAFQDRFGPFCR